MYSGSRDAYHPARGDQIEPNASTLMEDRITWALPAGTVPAYLSGCQPGWLATGASKSVGMPIGLRVAP